MISSLKYGILIAAMLLLYTSCHTMRKLDMNSLKSPEDFELIGTYEWRIRDHYSRFTIDNKDHFRHEFSNSGKRGFEVGKYVLSGHILTLISDSSITQRWTDILNENDTIYRSTDPTKYEFLVTENGLHEALEDGEYVRNPTYEKK